MEDYGDYRETPNTGRNPKYSDHEFDPVKVDPSELIDDRLNPDLLTFEKTWGHRVLAGIGVTMIVVAFVLVVFCIIQIVRIVDIIDILPIYALRLYMYIAVIIGGVALVPPGCIAIYVAKHPKKVAIAIAAAIVGIALIVLFLAYVLFASPQLIVAALAYSVLFAIIPVIYLVAALKIKRSL